MNYPIEVTQVNAALTTKFGAYAEGLEVLAESFVKMVNAAYEQGRSDAAKDCAQKKSEVSDRSERLYTSDEVAAMCKVKKYTVCEWVRKKRLPAIEVGTKYLISEKDLDWFFDNRRTFTPTRKEK